MMELGLENDLGGHAPDEQALRAAARDFREAARAQGRAEVSVPYGSHPRHAYDLFRPSAGERDHGNGKAREAAGNDAALAVFIHGGGWRRLDKGLFSHLAAGLNELGITVAVINYRLCPEVKIYEILGDVRQAAAHLARRFERPLVVIGHDAGAHLAACLTATDWKARGFDRQIVSGGLGISGIYDLRPLLGSSLNDHLELEEVDAYTASPLLWPAPGGRRFDLFAGGEQGRGLLCHGRSLHAAWRGCGVEGELAELPGEDHFSMPALLADARSPLTKSAHGLCLRA